MFAPEGYYNWEAATGAIGLWAVGCGLWADEMLQVKIAGLENDVGNNQVSTIASPLMFEKLTKFGQASSYQEAIFIEGLLHTWLLANFMKAYLPLVCSPSGRLMQSTPPIYLHADRLDWCPLEWPFRSSAYFRNYFDIRERHKPLSSDIDARSCSINVQTGLVTVKNNTSEMLGRCMHGIEECSGQWLSLVQPFAGWSLCWNPAEVPQDLAEVFISMGIDESEWTPPKDNRDSSRNSIDKNSPRPSGLAKAVQDTMEAYPSGKGFATWDEVEERVGFSRRHIVRALKQAGRYEGWARGGQD